MSAQHKEVIKRTAIDKAGELYATFLKKTHNFSREQFSNFQQDALYATYSDAVKRVPYYKNRELYSEQLPRDAFLEEFSRVPVLNKQTVKLKTSEFIRTPKSPFLLQRSTSGTTGSPLEIFQTPLERVKSNALRQSIYEKFCGLRTPRILGLSASLDANQVTLQLPRTNHAYASIYHLIKRHRTQIVGLLRTFQPEIIHGFPSALAQLAFLLPDGLPYELPGKTVRCISTSETLFPDTRRVIEDNLGVIVHNEYGSQEGQHFAFECDHRGMHIHPARGYVEVLKFESDRPAGPGEAGRIVVTGFQNRQMPLIRYSIGDTASTAPEDHRCSCGSQWPVLQDLHGRTQDLVRTRDGNRIGLIESATLRTVPGIAESQIVQTGYESFTYRIVASEGYDLPQAEALINELLADRLGYPIDVSFEYVETIEKTSSGKHRAVIVDF